MTRQQLIEQIRAKRSFLCVGLDPDLRKMPASVLEKDESVYEFNKAIIDATAPYCVAYKPNLAFYEALGLKGMVAFEKTCSYLRTNYPHHLLIADAKRGDIGNTSEMYARTFFGEYDVDALTVAPYMGEDSVLPFLGYSDKWVIMLALTSNKGSFDFQHLACDGELLFEHVLRKGAEWGTEENMMFVVGATQAPMLNRVRQIVPRHFLLLPGIGAQGGSLHDACQYGLNSDCGLLVNSSRGIIYASAGQDFAEEAAAEARRLQQEMAEELQQFAS